jgi:transglutaminase-like putative cysteine protease
MSLELYFRVSSYTLIVTSFLMLVSTGQLDGLTLALYSGSLVVGWLIDGGMNSLSLSRRATNGLRIGYLPLMLIDWQVLNSPPVIVVTHFILFISACKLFEKKSHRDWLWLYLVAFFELIMAAGMTIDATFLGLLIVFLFAAVSSLVSFEIRRASEAFGLATGTNELWRESKQGRRPMSARRHFSIAGFSAVALGVVLLLAAPLFLAMPRIGRAAFGGRLLRTSALSGFSNSVRLGEVASVKLNPQVVMRVRVTTPPGLDKTRLRWRGVTFDEYDGQTWSDSVQQLQPVRRAGEGFQLEMPVPLAMLTEQTFFLEPLDLSTVFAAPSPIFVGDVSSLQRDAGDGLWTENHALQRLQYRVYSYTGLPTESALASDVSRLYPPDVRRRYLQLPIDRDRRIDQLAAEVTAGAATPLETARMIESHLQTGYGYSLDLKRTTDGDPVADFLFNIRAGHCEYFATAMVLMLRARRIPARLVNGFQMGEYSDVAGVYTVRQSDAHSWVEVYFAQNRWVAFDPTPAAGMSTYGGGLAAQLRQYLDAFELFWQERIVGFGSNDQAAMLLGLQRWLASYERSGERGWLSWTDSVAKWATQLFRGDAAVDTDYASRVTSLLANASWVVAAALLLTGLSLWWRRHLHSWRRRFGRDRAGSAVAFYQEMLGRLERVGMSRDPHLTPREFAASVAWPSVTELTRYYERARFGSDSLDERDLTRIRELLAEVKSAARDLSRSGRFRIWRPSHIRSLRN